MLKLKQHKFLRLLKHFFGNTFDIWLNPVFQFQCFGLLAYIK
jgi:hypothetical protein